MNGQQRKMRKKGGCFVRALAYYDSPDAELLACFIRCKLHPWYKAICAPRADCDTCKTMFRNKMEAP